MQKSIIKIFGIGLLFFLVFSLIMKSFFENKKLEKEHKFTIGKVTKVKVNTRLGESVYYDFVFNGTKYSRKEIIYIKMHGFNKTNILGKKFLVKFQPSDPKNCKIMLNHQVKDGINSPPTGWDKIPDLK